MDAEAKYCQILKEQGYHRGVITHSGLVIDLEEPCLACSPDDLVELPGYSQPFGLVEYKCPYSLAHGDSSSPQTAEAAAIAKKKGFFCVVNESGQVRLKRNHDYFYQVQGNLAITKRQWCDFVVWTPRGTSVERIYADKDFWETAKQKLIEFYRSAVLPELALPRIPNGQSIREPFQPSSHS